MTLEGVTQYIPKPSTADTLKKLHAMVATGSTLLMSYVDQNVFDDPAKCGPIKAVENVRKMPGATGEPWISGWTQVEFATFLKELGYQVESDTTAKDYNDSYLEPLGRRMKEEEILNMERFVVAKTV
jgi:O-methyltransferase involved in polyketide biosynthesis